MQPNYQAELKVAKSAAKAAGLYLKTQFFKWQRGQEYYKTAREMATRCDRQSEKIIIDLLKKHFPKYSFLSEESGKTDKNSDFIWVIDPLDGTVNFTNHNPDFGVSIALLYKNEVVMGVIYIPFLDEMYWATKNQKAYCNGRQISPAKKYNIKDHIIGYNHGHGKTKLTTAVKVYKHFQTTAYRVRNFYSISLQMVLTAAGYTDAYLVTHAPLWDVAAGVLILKQAGAKVTDFKNRPWTIKSISILATNPKSHAIYLKELKKIKLA